MPLLKVIKEEIWFWQVIQGNILASRGVNRGRGQIATIPWAMTVVGQSQQERVTSRPGKNLNYQPRPMIVYNIPV